MIWKPSEGLARADAIVGGLEIDAGSCGVLSPFPPVYRHRMVDVIAIAIDNALEDGAERRDEVTWASFEAVRFETVQFDNRRPPSGWRQPPDLAAADIAVSDIARAVADGVLPPKVIIDVDGVAHDAAAYQAAEASSAAPIKGPRKKRVKKKAKRRAKAKAVRDDASQPEAEAVPAAEPAP